MAPQRCPFIGACAIFLGVSVIGPEIFFLALPDVWPSAIFLVQLVGIGLFASWLETRRLSGSDCPWLEVGAASRLILYFLLWLVGSLMLFALAAVRTAPVLALALLGVLVFVPVVSLLRLHITVDHSELEEVGVRPWLVAASRLPVYLLFAFGALVVVLGGIEALHMLRQR
jgi:hypothetical protein